MRISTAAGRAASSPTAERRLKSRRAVCLLENAQKLGPGGRTRGFEGGFMIAPSMLAPSFTFSSLFDAV